MKILRFQRKQATPVEVAINADLLLYVAQTPEPGTAAIYLSGLDNPLVVLASLEEVLGQLKPVTNEGRRMGNKPLKANL